MNPVRNFSIGKEEISNGMKKNKTIILGVTGSIAAYKACDIVNKLRAKGHQVFVIMTKEAQQFITPLSLQTLSANKVFCDMFAPVESWDPVHTSLADKADVVLIAPCSANIIGKLAHGICDDLLTCVAIATDAPKVIAPAMNEKMYANKVVKENIAKLTGLGYKFVGPTKGHLACGHVGIGHIATTEDIVKQVEALFR